MPFAAFGANSIPHLDGKSPETALLLVKINGQSRPEPDLLLRLPDDAGLAASQAEFEAWRLKPPAVNPVRYDEADWFPLNAVANLRVREDASTLTLDLEAPSELFQRQEIETRFNPLKAEPRLSDWGAYLNYDTNLQYVQNGTTSLGVLTELAGFGPWGIVFSDFVAADLMIDYQPRRLNTTFVYDMPEDRQRLQLGDVINRPASAWGGAVRLAGVQWATNFGTQPWFITFPMPAIQGEAQLPSSVEVLVGGQSRYRGKVDPGPFSLNQLPVNLGMGEGQLITRDLLGREQSANFSYYVNPRLLKEGLHDFSYEAGITRRNYGLTDFDYGRPLIAGTHRYGFNDELTAEAHGEFLLDQQTFGLSASATLFDLAAGHVSLAGSRSGQGWGRQIGLGIDRQMPFFGFSANTRFATSNFTQLGYTDNYLPPGRIDSFTMGFNLSEYGYLTGRYAHLSNREKNSTDLISATYNVTLGDFGNINLSYYKALDTDDSGFMFSFTRSIDRSSNTFGSANANFTPAGIQGTAVVQRNLPIGEGWGYRVSASEGLVRRYQAGATLATDFGRYFADVAYRGDSLGFRGQAAGSLALLGNYVFASRPITDSFAAVEVPEAPNVQLYWQNQPVAKTNADGFALIPRLLSYQKNTIRAEQSDLPLDAQVGGVTVEAVPYFRSGYYLKFPIQRSRGGTVTIYAAKGKFMPAGAFIQVNDQPEPMPVAERGEAYLIALKAHNRLRITWAGQRCEADLAYPETLEPLPDLGKIHCDEVNP